MEKKVLHAAGPYNKAEGCVLCITSSSIQVHINTFSPVYEEQCSHCLSPPWNHRLIRAFNSTWMKKQQIQFVNKKKAA